MSMHNVGFGEYIRGAWAVPSHWCSYVPFRETPAVGRFSMLCCVSQSLQQLMRPDKVIDSETSTAAAAAV